LLPASITLIAALALGLHVLLRPRKVSFHWLLCGVLLGVSIWSAGSILRWTVDTVDGLRSSLQLLYLGVLVAPLCWLMLAGSMTRAAFARSPAAIAMLCTPPALMYLCLVTNEGHRLFVRDVSFTALEAGPSVFAGPVLWVAIAWAYAAALVSALLHFRAARGAHRSRGFLMAGAALVPMAASVFYIAELVPLRFDLTPSGFVFTMGVLYVATFRYQLLESVPLAHRAVVDQLDDGVVMASHAGSIVDCNPSAERLLRECAASLRGRRLDEVLAPFRALAASGDADPEGRLLEIGEGEVSHGEGHAVGRFALLFDRGDEHRSEQLVQRAQRLETVGALAAGIAHEINDPLAFACSNLAQVVRMGEVVEARRESLDAELARELEDLHAIAVEALDGVERMARIAADMRCLTAQPHRVKLPLDLAAVVRDAMRIAQVDAADASGADAHSEDAGVWVEGSPERLVQVVVNLLANARQAAGEDGVVRVEVRGRGDTAEIAVEDDGPGIPDALRERIFDPFFTTKGPDAGSGLGLAIAYDIVRDHGGVLEECGEPGCGARFVLRLPRAASQGAGAET
jgi:signal transduction histidine kinase